MKSSKAYLPLIAGREVDCEGRREIRSPWDRSLVGLVGLAGPAEIEAAIASAEAAAPLLAEAPAFRRAEWLESVVALLRRDAEALASTIVGEAGKPLKLARLEVSRAIETFSLSAAEARRLGGEVIPLDAVPAGEGRIGITRRFPLGPIAAITPFNFPLNLVAHKVGPALAAGCPLILKPADQTPLTALLLGAMVAESGAPPGSMSVVPCELGQVTTLVRDDRLFGLSFTGSDKVGWELKAQAGRKRVLLELGGNAAVIVHSDADLKSAAARCALGAFAYAGQVCISVQRIFVQEDVRDEFVALLLEETQSLPVGDPRDPDVLVGPVRSDEDADRIMARIEEAIASGAQLLCGGARDGRLITPTLLSGVEHRLPVCSEEVFGPVAMLETYRDGEQALELVNRSAYGLQAGIFTSDVRLLMRAFEKLKVGAVIHDDSPSFRADNMPYGGVKASGIGREGVRYAVEEMTEIRMLALKK